MSRFDFKDEPIVGIVESADVGDSLEAFRRFSAWCTGYWRDAVARDDDRMSDHELAHLVSFMMADPVRNVTPVMKAAVECVMMVAGLAAHRNQIYDDAERNEYAIQLMNEAFKIAIVAKENPDWQPDE